MCDLVFIDDSEDLYIHPISSEFKKLNINNIDEYGILIPDYKYAIMSIDVGITHLGLSIGITDEAFNLIQLEWVKMIDITQYTHQYDLQDKCCGVNHSSKCFADWLQHLFLEYETLFECCNYILVEKQPPSGLVVIEQIIMFRWRDKCHLVHPRSMHSFFNMGLKTIKGNESYEKRKEKSQLIAEKSCKWHRRAVESYSGLIRKHDVTDSICLMLYWLFIKNKEYTRQRNLERTKNLKLPNLNGMSGLEWMESMKYVKY